MNKLRNKIPTVEESLYFLQGISCNAVSKDYPLSAEYYEVKEVIIDSVHTHPTNPEEYVHIKGKINGETTEIDFPKYKDSVEKVKNPFYSELAEAHAAVVVKCKAEKERLDILAERIRTELSLIESCIELHLSN